MTAVYDMIDNFFGIGSSIGRNIGSGIVNMERAAKSIEASAVNTARAYTEIAAGSGMFSDILQSAAAVNMIGAGGTIPGNNYAGGGEFFSANRKGINEDISVKKLPFDIGIGGGIDIALQYSAALETARNAAFGTLGILGALGAAVNEVRNYTSGAYEITLSFGGILGGTIAVALAVLGNSVIWLRKLCADSMTQIGNSAMVLAAFFGGMWNEPLSLAVTRFMWFGSSALSIIESVISAVSSVAGAALPLSVNGVSQKSVIGNTGGLSEFSVGNSTIIKSDLFNRVSPITSNVNSFFSPDYIRYDQAFAAGYLIGDLLMRSVGNSGNSYTNISSSNSEKIAAEVSRITENTSKSVSASEISTEELKYLRDIAARDVINRFTTAQVSVSMGGVTNNLSGTADLDGIIDYLANGVKTAMESAAEGVHS